MIRSGSMPSLPGQGQLLPHREKRTKALSPVWLFLLFCFYGPSITIIGEFRYVEIALIIVLAAHVRPAIANLGQWERRFIGLFLLTALTQVLSDLLNNASLDGTLKRSFTYILLALLIVVLRYLSRGDIKRLRWMLAGYCVSFVTVLFIGQTASANYAVAPWRLGLGTAATIGICLLPLWFPRVYRLVGLGLLAMSAAHLFLGGRALAILTALAGIAAVWGWWAGRPTPPRFRLLAGLGVLAGLILTPMLATQGARLLTDADVLPADLQTKMVVQLSNPYGLLAAGRPDTAAAVFGITQRPLLGYGSTNADPAVMAYYHNIIASSFADQGTYFDRLHREQSKEWELGTPSHSHLFGAWVDAGVVAAISWMVVFALALFVCWKSALWRHPVAPLFVLISLLVMWDTLFSPGPIRFEVALRLAILVYATEMFRHFELGGTASSLQGHTPKLKRTIIGQQQISV